MDRPDLRTDRQDIAEVLLAYATAIDRRDWDLFRTCFDADVAAHYEGLEPWSGVEAMTSFMIDAHAEMGHTLHRLSNMAIQVQGDRAVARTYVDAVLMATDGQSGLNPIGFYDDELVRTPSGWRIAKRSFTYVAFRTVP